MFYHRAGDAAHSFPPTGGLGLNSGLGDVHNLAYKLAAVHHGWGGDELLDTYESDRRQVALVNSQQSVKNGLQIFGLLKTLGTTDPDVEVARRNLHRNIEDPQAMVEINKGIEGQREHFDNLALHIGYVYGDTHIPENASAFQPICTPGARLPHAWIQILAPEKVQFPPIDSLYVSELSADQVKSKQYSTLDLCPFDAFTIVVDLVWASHWETCIQEMRKSLPVRVDATLTLRTAVLGLDFQLQPAERSEEWINLMRLNEGQATLVRPDQHILACLDSKKAGSSDLLRALEGHLAWESRAK